MQRFDLKGKEFGRLTALQYKPIDHPIKPLSAWLCICECGKLAQVQTRFLIHYGVKSCGCMGFTTHDLTGLRMGQTTVLARTTCQGTRGWICRCDCGTYYFKTTGKLKQRQKEKLPINCGCKRYLPRRQTLLCKHCGASFQGTPRARYCSKKCMERASGRVKSSTIGRPRKLPASVE